MTRFMQRRGCEVTELDHEWLILNTELFTVTKLNEVGGFCWNLLTSAQSLDSLIKEVKHAFPETPAEDVLNEELTEFIDYLDSCRLIRYVS